MKALVDTNVILDVLFHRDPFFDHSRTILELAEQKRMSGFISASAFTDIFYLVNKKIKKTEIVYKAADKLTAIFTIVPVFEHTIKTALALHWKDFEDAVQYIAAQENKADYIITRNKNDYETSAIPSVNPADFMAIFKASETVREEQ